MAGLGIAGEAIPATQLPVVAVDPRDELALPLPLLVVHVLSKDGGDVRVGIRGHSLRNHDIDDIAKGVDLKSILGSQCLHQFLEIVSVLEVAKK